MTDNQWKHVVGLVAVLGLISLVAAVAIGHVEEKTSYNLPNLASGLTAFVLLYGGWAYNTRSSDKPKDPEDPKV